MTPDQKRIRDTARTALGLGLVALGALFLCVQIAAFNPWRFLWPFFVILPGALFFLGMALGGKAAGALAIPGSIVTMTGLILLYQSVTGHWQSWAYAWSLVFPSSVGLGLFFQGIWSGDDRVAREGIKLVKAGAAIFLAAGAFFEIILNISGFRSGIGGILWPALLILAGIVLLVGRRGGRDGVREDGEARVPPASEGPGKP